jgi:hypothetical protein
LAANEEPSDSLRIYSGTLDNLTTLTLKVAQRGFDKTIFSNISYLAINLIKRRRSTSLAKKFFNATWDITIKLEGKPSEG